MKEIKAFIRTERAEEVIERLQEIGVKGFTLIDVMGIGDKLLDPEHARYSLECVEKFSKIAKLELVAPEDKVDIIVANVKKIAFTGLPGDGIIYVCPVEEAYAIRSGKTGEKALQ